MRNPVLDSYPVGFAIVLGVMLMGVRPVAAQDCGDGPENWDDIQGFRRCVQEHGLDFWTPWAPWVLHDAARLTGNPAIVQVLLQAGADPNAVDDNGLAALHHGARNTNPVVVSHLLAAGASLNALDNEGYTPLHWAAAQSGNGRVVARLLDAGANPLAESNDGRTPLHSALRYSAAQSVISVLVRAGAAENLTPLQLAVLQDDSDVVASLLGEGADPNVADAYGWSALHFAAPLGALAVVSALLEAQADPNARTESSATGLLLAAASNNDPSVVLALLDAGADPAARANAGTRAVDLARANDAVTGTGAYRRLLVNQPSPLLAGRSATGDLEPTGGVGPGLSYYDEWSYSAMAGQRIVVTMESEDVDAYVVILRDDGTEVASDDDGGDGLNARVEFRAPATGRYTFLATSAVSEQSGRYTIRVERPPGGIGGEAHKLAPPRPTVQKLQSEKGHSSSTARSLEASVPPTPSGDDDGYYDRWTFSARARQRER